MIGRATCLLLCLTFALALSACSDDKKAAGTLANPLAPPSDAKAEIIATLKDLFIKNDTAKVTNAVMSDPAINTVGTSQLYTVCIRYTAHGTRPGMIGDAERIGYFYGGHLNQLIPADEGQCKAVAYKPFPELNEVCIGTGCRR